MLSDRYVADRFLPDKAIDLVDESASRLRMEMDSMPVELDEPACTARLHPLAAPPGSGPPRGRPIDQEPGPLRAQAPPRRPRDSVEGR